MSLALRKGHLKVEGISFIFKFRVGIKTQLRVLSLLRNRLLTRGLCQILVDLSPIVGVSWEFHFCMLILTVGSRLCTFCRLHLRTLRDHCRVARATPRSMTSA